MLFVARLAVAFVPSISLHEVGVSTPAACGNNRTLFLIRHAEGWHNTDELEAQAAFEAGESRWRDLDLRDPKTMALREEFGVAWMLLERVSGKVYHDPLLTPKGREQAYALRAALRQDRAFRIDAVAVSPMRRTIETALLSLPPLEFAATTFRIDGPLEGLRAREPPPIVATDLLRERVGPFMPDARLKRSALVAEYAALGANVSIDLNDVTEVDEAFRDGREVNEPETGSPLLAQRAAEALQWLARRPSSWRRLAVVSHRHFFYALTSLFPKSVSQRPFANAEMRRFLLCVNGEEDDEAGHVDDAHHEVGTGGATVRPVRARVRPLGSELSEQADA